ncbi:MAG: hybrid sensor histidine kinase/response regulator [Phycisphaerales bacterium]|nr:hybrid sensor histidine kinase/response regulator [Phycisphaerales bacterium]
MRPQSHPQHLLDALTAHTAVVADDGEIVSVNHTWKRFADENGLASRDYCVGESYHEACLPASRTDPVAAGVCDAIRGVCAGDLTRAEFEYPCHAPDERRWFVVHITPMRVGGKRFALVLHENVTRIKAAEESLATIADLLAVPAGEGCLGAIAEGLRRTLPADFVLVTEVLHTGEGRVRVLASAGRSLAEEGRGSTEEGLIVPLPGTPEARLANGSRSVCLPTGASESFADDPRLAGARGFIGSGAGEDELGRPLGMVGALWRQPVAGVDLARRVVGLSAGRVAEELQRRRAEAERERSEDLAARAEALDEKACETAHELKNLIFALQAHLKEASKTVEAGGSPRQAHAKLGELIRQAGSLANSLRDLASEPEPTRCVLSLAELARDAIATVKPLLPAETSVTLDADTRVRVLGNADQLQRALVNLTLNARNAMKADGGRIVVGVHAHGAEAVLSVTDSGEGVSGSVRDRMFERRFTTRRSEGGEGLGLTVVDEIARAHAGRVTVSTERGVGTTMAIILPALAAGAEATDSPSAERGRCALVIEDNPQVLKIVAGMLDSMGYSVVRRRGDEAFGEGRELLPPGVTLVVSDYRLPGNDGESLLRELREAGYTGPAVLMSGSRAGGVSADAKLGAALLAKPFGETELRSAIGLALDMLREVGP